MKQSFKCHFGIFFWWIGHFIQLSIMVLCIMSVPYFCNSCQGISVVKHGHMISSKATHCSTKEARILVSQRCKNVWTCKQCSCKMFASSGKIGAKFYAVLLQKWVMSRFCAFWCNVLALFGSLCYFLAFVLTILGFWSFYNVLSQIRLVAIYALFG